MKYVNVVKSENEKNVKSNDCRNIRQVAMYKFPNSEKCNVASVEKYLSMLPTENSALFPKPKRREKVFIVKKKSLEKTRCMIL